MSETCPLQDLGAATGLSKHDLRLGLRDVPLVGAPSGSAQKGRPGKRYLLSEIPEDLRNAVVAYRSRGNHPCKVVIPQVDPMKLCPKETALCMAKASAALEYRKYLASFGRGNIGKAEVEFVRIYNLGECQAWQEIFSKVGPVALQTFRRWNATLKENNDDYFCLADRRGKHRLGHSCVSERQGEIIAACYCTPNRPNVAQALRVGRIRMQAEGIDDWQTDETYRNWLRWYVKTHYDLVVFLRDGEKARQDKCEPTILRDWNRIMVGDVLFADGKTLNCELLNPKTGKGQRYHIIQFQDAKSGMIVGYEISCSENTESIAVALYRSILTLGKIPKVVYIDNGKAFRSRFFSGVEDLRLEPFVGVFKQLGIQVIFAKPYNARAKNIERFHRTMEDFERRVFSFIGVSIADKPARLNRAERFHKDRHARQFHGRLPTIEEFSFAYDYWRTNEYGERPGRGHLEGETPQGVFLAGRGPGFSEEEVARLRVLLSALIVREISKHGIRLPGCPTLYWHPDFYGRQLQSAVIRYDWRDKSRIFVYDSAGEFICVAEPRNRTHPAARPLGSPEDVEVVAGEIGMQKRLAKKTLDAAREMYEGSILPECNFQRESMGLQGVIPPASIKPELDAPLPKSTEETASEFTLSAEDQALIAAGVAELDDMADDQRPAPWDEVRNCRDVREYKRLLQLQAEGRELTISESTWLFVFESSPLFQQYRNELETIQLGAALRCEGA